MKKLSKTDPELKRSVAYKKKTCPALDKPYTDCENIILPGGLDVEVEEKNMSECM